jgi:adenylate cyclase
VGLGMAKVRIHGTTEVIQAGMLTSLLNALLSQGFPIRTLCGGKAQCGRCLIKIRSGASLLSPIREEERRKLQTLGAGPDHRLACQCYARGDVEIEVIHTVARGSPDP